MFSTRVAIGSAELLARSEWDPSGWARWLEAFGAVEPLAEAPGEDGEPLMLIGRDAGAPSAEGDFEPIALHEGRLGLRAPTDDGVVVAVAEPPTLYYLRREPSKGRVVLALNYPDATGNWELDAFQIVRGWLLARLEAQGRRRFGGSAVARGGRGLVLVGGGSAPATAQAAYQLALLHGGGSGSGGGGGGGDSADAGWGYVGGGRLHGAPDGMVHGLPAGLLAEPEAFGPLRDRLRSTTGADTEIGPALLWPAEVSSGFGVPVVPSTRPVAVVVCELAPQRSDVTISPLPADERERLIAGAMTDFPDGTRPQWLIDELGLDTPAGPGQSLTDLPWFRAVGDPWSPTWSAGPGGDLERHFVVG